MDWKTMQNKNETEETQSKEMVIKKIKRLPNNIFSHKTFG